MSSAPGTAWIEISDNTLVVLRTLAAARRVSVAELVAQLAVDGFCAESGIERAAFVRGADLVREGAHD